MTKPLEISLIQKPFPVARTIAGEEAEEFLKLYKNSLEQYNSKARQTLDKLSIQGGQLVGSSHFIRLHSDPILKENFNQRVIGFEDAGIMLANSPETLRGTYLDLELVRYDKEEPNAYLTKKLDPQLKKISWKGKTPITIDGLELVDDKRSEYGLAFKVGDNTVWKHAPHLSSENSRRNFAGFGKGGIEFDSHGDYTFYARDNGLSGLLLHRHLVLHSDYDLAGSGSDGRVWMKTA